MNEMEVDQINFKTFEDYENEYQRCLYQETQLFHAAVIFLDKVAAEKEASAIYEFIVQLFRDVDTPFCTTGT
jgi:hypothetical protein